MPAIVAVFIAVVIGILFGVGGGIVLVQSQGGTYPEQVPGSIVVYGTS